MLHLAVISTTLSTIRTPSLHTLLSDNLVQSAWPHLGVSPDTRETVTTVVDFVYFLISCLPVVVEYGGASFTESSPYSTTQMCLCTRWQWVPFVKLTVYVFAIAPRSAIVLALMKWKLGTQAQSIQSFR